MMTGTSAKPCEHCGTTGGFTPKDCNRPVRRKGYCASCYYRLQSHGTLDGYKPRRRETVTSIPADSPTPPAKPDAPIYVVAQRARLIGRERERIARREATPSGDYWRDVATLPLSTRQRAQVYRHIMGDHIYPWSTGTTCGVEPHVRAPLTLEDAVA